MENKNKEIRVSQKAVLFNKDGKLLTMRRTETAPSRPLHWDLPGGILEFGEDAREGIIREIKEETGLEIQDLKILEVISAFDDRNQFWVTICYSAQPITSKVKLSFEHNDFK